MKISIDLWGTLIKANPEFKKAKIELVKKYYPALHDKHIEESFKDVKNFLNNLQEISGFQMPTNDIFRFLRSTLVGQVYGNFLSDNLEEMIEDYQDLVFKYPPLIYSAETFEYLDKLSRIATLYLSSNTMMIRGNTLRDVLQNLDIKKHFKYLRFSDIQGYGKPHPRMYQSDYHIGDNMKTDFYGAQAAGSFPIIINNSENNKTIKDAYDIIFKN